MAQDFKVDPRLNDVTIGELRELKSWMKLSVADAVEKMREFLEARDLPVDEGLHMTLLTLVENASDQL